MLVWLILDVCIWTQMAKVIPPRAGSGSSIGARFLASGEGTLRGCFFLASMAFFLTSAKLSYCEFYFGGGDS